MGVVVEVGEKSAIDDDEERECVGDVGGDDVGENEGDGSGRRGRASQASSRALDLLSSASSLASAR